jgi:uncharacterized protein (TIGR02271 family)
MLTFEQLRALTESGAMAVSTSGERIGKIGDIYLDDQTQEPSWVTVKTGLFGSAETFVPLTGDATVQGEDLWVPYDKDTVKDAPRVEPDGNLSPQEEMELYRYYGLERTSGRGTASPGMGVGTPQSDVQADTDDAMTRSEEQVNVGTQREAVGKARLRKYVVTENVTRTVPVSREEVRVEREPITDANRDKAVSGPEITEAEHEVTLHAETPVVDKETVPVERVRLDTDTVTEQETIDETVRKEEIETDVPGRTERHER